jgi:hypothetical protein
MNFLGNKLFLPHKCGTGIKAKKIIMFAYVRITKRKGKKISI